MLSVEKMTMLALNANSCQSCEVLLRHWCDDLSNAIGDAVDSPEHSRDPLKAEQLEGPCKKMRMDEDLRRVIIVDQVQEGIARTPAQALRFAGHSATTGLGDAWMCQKLSEYLVSSWELMRTSGFVGVSSDGKRLGKPGKPGEDTNTSSCWNGLANLSVWLPIMVSGALISSMPSSASVQLPALTTEIRIIRIFHFGANVNPRIHFGKTDYADLRFPIFFT